MNIVFAGIIYAVGVGIGILAHWLWTRSRMHRYIAEAFLSGMSTSSHWDEIKESVMQGKAFCFSFDENESGMKVSLEPKDEQEETET